LGGRESALVPVKRATERVVDEIPTAKHEKIDVVTGDREGYPFNIELRGAWKKQVVVA
jgi:hypothetical protein